MNAAPKSITLSLNVNESVLLRSVRCDPGKCAISHAIRDAAHKDASHFRTDITSARFNLHGHKYLCPFEHFPKKVVTAIWGNDAAAKVAEPIEPFKTRLTFRNAGPLKPPSGNGLNKGGHTKKYERRPLSERRVALRVRGKSQLVSYKEAERIKAA